MKTGATKRKGKKVSRVVRRLSETPRIVEVQGFRIMAINAPPDAPPADIAVTPDGRVYSLTPPHLMRPTKNRGGYKRVTMARAGKLAYATIHQLVLWAHGDDAPSTEHEVRHLNGDRSDCRIENLAWGTAKENCNDRRLHGTVKLGEKHGNAKLSYKDVETIRREYGNGRTNAALSRRFGVTIATICSVARGRTWRSSKAALPPLGRARFPDGRHPNSSIDRETAMKVIAHLATTNSIRQTAREMNVPEHTVRHIRQGSTWRDLPRPWA